MAKYSRQISDEALAYIYSCYDRGMSVRECHDALVEVFGYITVQRNVRKYYNQAKSNPNQGAGKTVDWDDIKALEHWRVRLDHLPILRSAEAWLTSTMGNIPIINPKPTYRTARWQSHILSYSNSIQKALDLWVLGELWAVRETLAVYENKAIDKDDLEQWLSFAPWETGLNADAHVPYLKAIEQGIIPSLSTAPEGITLGHSQFLSVGIAQILANLVADQSYLLPTQQIAIYRKQTGSDSITIVLTLDGKRTPIDIELGGISGH